jgi:hypothetical protein
MDFVRAQMTEADLAAERQFNMIKEATAEAICESRPRPLTAAERFRKTNDEAVMHRREQAHIKRLRQQRQSRLMK